MSLSAAALSYSSIRFCCACVIKTDHPCQYHKSVTCPLPGGRSTDPRNHARYPQVDELSTSSREVVQSGFTGVLGLLPRCEGRTGNPDGTHVRARHRAPGGHISGLPTEAGTGPALVADDEREVVARRAPYFHIGDEIADTVKREVDCCCVLAQ
jgi:hypothetical protein